MILVYIVLEFSTRVWCTDHHSFYDSLGQCWRCFRAHALQDGKIRNVITGLLASFADRNRQEERNHDDRFRFGGGAGARQEPYDAIFEACMLRFRPILMTTMAALRCRWRRWHRHGSEMRRGLWASPLLAGCSSARCSLSTQLQSFTWCSIGYVFGCRASRVVNSIHRRTCKPPGTQRARLDQQPCGIT